MNTRGSEIGYAGGVAAIGRARTRAELAEALCCQVAICSGADAVVLSDVVGDEGRILVWHRGGRTESGRGPQPAYPVRPGSPESAAYASAGHPVRSAPAAAAGLFLSRTLAGVAAGGYYVIGVETGDSAVALLHLCTRRELPPDVIETVLLFTETAVATWRRIDAEDRLRAHTDGLRSLRERIGALEGVLAEQSTAASAGPDADAATAVLTDREREVYACILTGASNTDIATEFVLSVDTVKTHVKRILRKLGASNRAELIARGG
jgi:DNA-binding CsgD family transcriptional regulator